MKNRVKIENPQVYLKSELRERIPDINRNLFILIPREIARALNISRSNAHNYRVIVVKKSSI